MLLLRLRLPHFVQSVRLVCDEELWSLSTARLVHCLSAFKFFLKAILIKSLQLFNTFAYTVSIICVWLWLWRCRGRFFLLGSSSWIGEVIESFGFVLSIAV